MTEKLKYETLQPPSALDNLANHDTAIRVAIFSDIDEAVAFRRRFPHWEVHCHLILPRYIPSCPNNTKVSASHEPRLNVLIDDLLPQTEQTPMAMMTTKTDMIELNHPIFEVPATADILGFWQENGRLLGLELHFPDGHHTFLTFQEIQELQT